MLTAAMQTLIADHSAGMVATVNDDGTPSVSPKATFIVRDAATLAFGDIRSPGTVANLRARPAVEVCFIDVILRRAVRVAGTATVVARADAPAPLVAAFAAAWPAYLPLMAAFVTIDVRRAAAILSPAYDIGLSAAELRRSSLARLNGL